MVFDTGHRLVRRWGPAALDPHAEFAPTEDDLFDLDPLSGLPFFLCWVELAECYLEIGDADTALAVARHAVRCDPKNGRLYSLIASAYSHRGDVEEARHAYEDALQYLTAERWTDERARIRQLLSDLPDEAPPIYLPLPGGAADG